MFDLNVKAIWSLGLSFYGVRDFFVCPAVFGVTT